MTEVTIMQSSPDPSVFSEETVSGGEFINLDGTEVLALEWFDHIEDPEAPEPVRRCRVFNFEEQTVELWQEDLENSYIIWNTADIKVS